MLKFSSCKSLIQAEGALPGKEKAEMQPREESMEETPEPVTEEDSAKKATPAAPAKKRGVSNSLTRSIWSRDLALLTRVKCRPCSATRCRGK